MLERGKIGGGIEIVSILMLQKHSLDLLKAAPWRMTKAVFSLPHSFFLMFSADKLFVSQTKTWRDKGPAKFISGLSSLLFLYLCFLAPDYSSADRD